MAVLEKEIEFESHGATLRGLLSLPDHATGTVIFAHGSGSSRFSQRNRFVASELQKAGCATLLLDLLGEGEAHERDKVFNIPLLADRLTDAKLWLLAGTELNQGAVPQAIGYFGASTGAGAALYAAAQCPHHVTAVVSRGGRPDLADECLGSVYAPTLLIVGGEDDAVIEMNQKAFAKLACEKELKIIPGASHLFIEAGTLEAVAELAASWFVTHFTAHKRSAIFPVPA
ncbi:MAG: hypothetical protein RIQ81_1576 [Pseudomonadota bacterium]|jgi:putative phosphoribosyl transferase